MSTLTWALLLLAAGLILLIAEVFVPSGGLIGLLALGLVVLSLYNAWQHSTAALLGFLAADMAILPAAMAWAFYIWPKTPLGKLTFLRPPEAEDYDTAPASGRVDHLVGLVGRALTPLRPAGLVDFDGRRLDAMSEDGLIPAGASIRAVRAQGGRLVVRATSAHPDP